MEDPRQLQLLNEQGFSFANMAQVEAFARTVALRVGDRMPVQGKTFGELCQSWLNVGCKRRLDVRNEARHVELLRGLWTLHEGDLTPKKVRAALAALLKPTGTLGPASANMVRSKGMLIIREAQLDEAWGGSNPFDLVPTFKVPRPQHVLVTLAHARLFLPHLRRDRWRESVFNLALGPRPGEWKALLKTDVHLGEGWLVFRRSNHRDRTKTGVPRTVPIPSILLPVLREAMKASRSELVFPDPQGRRQRAGAAISKVLRTAYKAAGIITHWEAICRRRGCGYEKTLTEREEGRCPRCDFKLWLRGVPPRVRLYDLRHAAATLHAEAGCSPTVIRMVLGHSGEGMTEKVYTHLSLEFQKSELDKLNLLG